MRRRPIRRAQLIAPFGPGAMMVTPDGSSLMAAGLDHWYTPPSDSTRLDPTEFLFHEWRLEGELGVDRFGLPPDYREPRDAWGDDRVNTNLRVPFLRFPRWHVCPVCGRLQSYPLEMRDRPRCPACEEKPKGKSGKAPFMVQVRFIAICDNGHVQDFPWREWVHETASPTCQRPMRLFTTGGSSLSATRVTCDCGASRSLEGITQADPPIAPESPGGTEADSDAKPEPSTYLSRELAASGQPFLCQGHHPWLDEETGRGCSRPLRGSLRGATNVYFALTRGAIFLPRGGDAVPTELVAILSEAPVAGTITLLRGVNVEPTPALLKQHNGPLLGRYSDEQIAAALALVSRDEADDEPGVEGDDPETAFRRAEHAALRVARTEEQLKTRPMDMTAYAADIARLIAGVSLVEKLRETRAFTGFARVFAENQQSLAERQAMLWRDPPTCPNRWLPAYIVFGEGIYLEFNEDLLREWERREDVKQRVTRLGRQLTAVRARRGLEERRLPRRQVLLHTFAHLLMNQLIFDCGYSSAALRERLYVSDNAAAPMAGLLIYTAAGDSEGTMGGLVRMGRPGNLERVIRGALHNARWCSSDPVCMELGATGGQGPDSCNLAACHNCALVPETSCEIFNRLLDRWLVVGAPDDPSPGFFAAIA
ncbi:MAG: DUF1998 domain-containing protein [Chloroflexota bacterium]|nr:DUF1998 domain-containing protein [Chloroflexota bacterium]